MDFNKLLDKEKEDVVWQYTIKKIKDKLMINQNYLEGKISDEFIVYISDMRVELYGRNIILSYTNECLDAILNVLTSKYYYFSKITENELIDLIKKEFNFEDRICTSSANSIEMSLKMKKILVNIVVMLISKINFEDHNIDKNIFCEKIFGLTMGEVNTEKLLSLPHSTLSSTIELLTSDNFYNGVIKEKDLDLYDKRKEIEGYLTRILTSENYANGLIDEEQFNLFLDNYFSNNYDFYRASCYSITDVLTSKNFGEGKVRFEDLALLAKGFKNKENKMCIKDFEYLASIIMSDNYANGLVQQEWLNTLANQISSYYLYDFKLLLESKNYKNGKIENKDIIYLLESAKQEYGSSNKGNETTCIKLMITDLYCDEKITFDDIKFLIEEKYTVIALIISLIIMNDKNQFSKEEQETYILALLNLENKDSLCDLCDSYIKTNKAESEDEFAKNFVLYLLPVMLCCESFKKKEKKKEENKLKA